MALIYKEGDLVKSFLETTEFDYIAHQCNCRAGSENCSGIARTIFDVFPEAAKNQDEVSAARNPWIELGKFKESKEGVLNLYSQFNPGRPTYGIDSLECRMSYLKEVCQRLNIGLKGFKLGIPLIASGLAKSHLYDYSDLEYFQKIIAPIIEPILIDVKTTVVIWK